jgi:hypothetical protein
MELLMRLINQKNNIMKTIKKQFKLITTILSVIILLQGCTVYKSADVTLDEAAMSGTKVRIKTNDNQTLKFKTVEVENGNYYGLLYFKNTWVKTELNKDNINKVQIKDKAVSTVLNIVVPLAIIGIIMEVSSSGGFFSWDGVKCNPCN